MTTGYEVGVVARVRARHRMPVEGPEGRPHEHDYRVELVATRHELDERGMVVDLDVLRTELARVIEPLSGRDLDDIRPADAAAVTVEVLARWLHGSLEAAVRSAGAEGVRVRVWETDDAWARYATEADAGGVPFVAPGVRPHPDQPLS